MVSATAFGGSACCCPPGLTSSDADERIRTSPYSDRAAPGTLPSAKHPRPGPSLRRKRRRPQCREGVGKDAGANDRPIVSRESASATGLTKRPARLLSVGYSTHLARI